MTVRATSGVGQGVAVAGFEQTLKNLRSLTGRERQNIARKAARATMQRFRRAEQEMWKGYPVKKSSLEWSKSQTKTYKSGRTKQVASYSVRMQSAKAVTVNVRTKRSKQGGGYMVQANTFLNYHKKNAGAARFAHLLDLGTKRTLPTFQMRKLYTRRVRGMSADFIRAMSAWIFKPKASARQVAKVLDI